MTFRNPGASFGMAFSDTLSGANFYMVFGLLWFALTLCWCDVIAKKPYWRVLPNPLC